MAEMKVIRVDKRTVTVDVLWDDGLQKKGIVVSDVPVESFEEARSMLNNYISGVYQTVKAEAEREAYNNPQIDPRVLAAVGHTFDNDGNLVS